MHPRNEELKEVALSFVSLCFKSKIVSYYINFYACTPVTLMIKKKKIIINNEWRK